MKIKDQKALQEIFHPHSMVVLMGENSTKCIEVASEELFANRLYTSSAPEEEMPEVMVLHRYLSQPAAPLYVDFPKHFADCTRIYSWFACRLAPQKLLLRLITKGVCSIRLETVSVSVCLSGMKLRVYCD